MNYDLLKSCLADQGVTMIGKNVVRELLSEAERRRDALRSALDLVQEHGQSMPELDRAHLERLLSEALR